MASSPLTWELIATDHASEPIRRVREQIRQSNDYIRARYGDLPVDELREGWYDQ